MKTVRFTQVVGQSGPPQVYLLFSDPEKDPDFQKALKADRLMTIQHAAGKTDFGTVGYDPEVRGEILIFPRTLKPFADARIVGIDYDLLEQEHEAPQKEPEPKTKPAPPKTEIKLQPKPAAKSKTEPPPKPKPESKAQRKAAEKAEAAARQAEFDLKHEIRPPAKVISFSDPESTDDDGNENDDSEDSSEEVAKLTAGIRRALKALEAGKQVAAFNLLKKLLE
jgi:hypothetical protein